MTYHNDAPLTLIRTQRSHVLFVLSNATRGREAEFSTWYRGVYRDSSLRSTGALRVQQYERHEVDITHGEYPPPPFRYLAMYDLSVDGAEAVSDVIAAVERLHKEETTAEAAATWLYYPAGEKVGRSPKECPSMLTLAFANAVAGRDVDFCEWYVTRHIRHALNIPALVSGQCFFRTQFQRPGALEVPYQMIAVYEQEGSPESIIESLSSLPRSTFHFPSMDPIRFAEWVYRPL